MWDSSSTQESVTRAESKTRNSSLLRTPARWVVHLPGCLGHGALGRDKPHGADQSGCLHTLGLAQGDHGRDVAPREVPASVTGPPPI